MMQKLGLRKYRFCIVVVVNVVVVTVMLLVRLCCGALCFTYLLFGRTLRLRPL
jgi:hypothetical protein